MKGVMFPFVSLLLAMGRSGSRYLPRTSSGSVRSGGLKIVPRVCLFPSESV